MRGKPFNMRLHAQASVSSSKLWLFIKYIEIVVWRLVSVTHLKFTIAAPKTIKYHSKPLFYYELWTEMLCNTVYILFWIQYIHLQTRTNTHTNTVTLTTTMEKKNVNNRMEFWCSGRIVAWILTSVAYSVIDMTFCFLFERNNAFRTMSGHIIFAHATEWYEDFTPTKIHFMIKCNASLRYTYNITYFWILIIYTVDKHGLR